MKNSVLYLISLSIILVVVTLHFAEAKPHQNDDHCECHYVASKNGCIIARGPRDTGYKCSCRISRFAWWTHCVGTRLQCNAGENCPSGCASQECCLVGGGNCSGY